MGGEIDERFWEKKKMTEIEGDTEIGKKK